MGVKLPEDCESANLQALEAYEAAPHHLFRQALNAIHAWWQRSRKEAIT